MLSQPFYDYKNIAVLTGGKQNSGYIHDIIFSSKNAMGL